MENTYEKARRAVKEALLNEDWKIMDEVFEEINKEEPFNLVPESVRVPSPFVEPENKDIIKTRAARQTVFFMSFMPIFSLSGSLYQPIVGKVSFYDLAEAIMAFFMDGKLSVDSMPIAKRKDNPDNLRRSLKRLIELMQELGFVHKGRLTGTGDALAKALLRSVALRGDMSISFYLSSAVANTLLVEIDGFLKHEENAKAVLMETNARHKRIRGVVEDWLRNAPRLYLRDAMICYDWEDAVKDVMIKFREKKEDIRFAL